MSNTLAKIKEKLAALEKQKDEALQVIRKDFPSLFTDLFDKSVLINSISWTQYTPYFMDGDECIFGVNADELEVNNINFYEDEDEDEPQLDWIDEVKYTDLKTEIQVLDFKEFLQTERGKSYAYLSDRAKVGGYGYLPNPNYNKDEAAILIEFSNIIYTIPEDFLRSLFGDHVKVTVYRDGRIETDDYEHD